MTQDDIELDRIYDEQYARSYDDSSVSQEVYDDLKEKYENLEKNIKRVIELIRDDKVAEAYEYAVSERLV